MENVDKIVPTQPDLMKFFSGGQDEVDKYCYALEPFLNAVLPAKTIEEKWDIALPSGVTYFGLGTSLHTLYFYQMLIRLGRYQHVLELGTFVGVSTLFLAEAVSPPGKVSSVEAGKEFYEFARCNIERNGLADRVNLLRVDVLLAMRFFALRGIKFDLILMDAAKQYYDRMLTLALECLRPGGLILVDDVFMQGDALNDPPTTEKGKGVRAMLDKLTPMKEITKVILPIGDGLLMIMP